MSKRDSNDNNNNFSTKRPRVKRIKGVPTSMNDIIKAIIDTKGSGRLVGGGDMVGGEMTGGDMTGGDNGEIRETLKETFLEKAKEVKDVSEREGQEGE